MHRRRVVVIVQDNGQRVYDLVASLDDVIAVVWAV